MNAFLIFISTWVGTMTASYYLYRWHPAIAIVSFLFAGIITALFYSRQTHQTIITEPTKTTNTERALLAITFICDIILIIHAVSSETSDAISSPWIFYSLGHFILFTCATWTLFALAKSSISDKLLLATSILHHFTAWSVVAFIIHYGFGFDPFIHRTAIKEIIENGVILPKQPYYVGEYVLETSLSLLKIPLTTIDKWLVPMLASILIPWSLLKGLRDSWRLSDSQARTWMNAALFLPLMPFVFTVPHNINVILWLVTIFLLPKYRENHEGRLVLIAIALLAMSQHPLLGIPLTILIFVSIIFPKHQKPKTRIIFVFILTTLSIPLLLAINQIKLGATPFSYTNPLARLDFFFGLFKNSYTNPESADFFMRALYGWKTYFPIIGLALAMVGFYRIRKNESAQILVASLAGLLLAIFGTSTLFYIPGIAWYEQSEFAYRLLFALGIGLLPLIISGLVTITEKIKIETLILVLSSFAMTISWYFSYPQNNQIVNDNGSSVSESDSEAINFIETHAKDKYVVLADQMTSVRALEMLGFERAQGKPIPMYPLPAQEEIYSVFLEMAWQSPLRIYALRAMDIAKVDKVYLLIPSYYPASATLKQIAQNEADFVYETSNGNMLIAEYDR
ncbi:MAG: hypothetical protein WCJ29_00100 [bacterium]